MTLSLFAFGVYFQLQKAHSSYMNEMTLSYFEMLNTSTIEALAPSSHHGKLIASYIRISLFRAKSARN